MAAKMGVDEYRSGSADADTIGQEQDGSPLFQIAHSISSRQGLTLLNAIASASFTNTDHVLPLILDIAADTIQRWIQRCDRKSLVDVVATVSGLAKVLPFVPYIGPVVSDFLTQCSLHELSPLTPELNSKTMTTTLIAAFRLLSYDLDAFRDCLSPGFLIMSFNHERKHIRYLAIQCFAMNMGSADKITQDLIHKHVGEGVIDGPWEEVDRIDYRLFKLHEEKRWTRIYRKLLESDFNLGNRKYKDQFDHHSDISPYVVSIGGVLLPTKHATSPPLSSFVLFPTSEDNLTRAALGLRNHKPILLYGPADAGKTAVIRELAHKVGTLSGLVTLHLNEQTDAKSLLGIYTSSLSGTGFQWQPGVLTKAIQEGRWVLIEDIDRAPAEVMGLLRPLIENNELFLSNRKERLRPKDGFRLLGTIRTSGPGSALAIRTPMLTNRRLWTAIEVQPYCAQEVQILLSKRFPDLTSFLLRILSAHARLVDVFTTNEAFKSCQSRLPNIKDLLKWCRRTVRHLRKTSNDNQIPDTFMIDMFKDGVDCYAAHLADKLLVNIAASAIAASLNIAPAAVEHTLKHQKPIMQDSKSRIQVGRASLTKNGSSHPSSGRQTSFATTRQVLQHMETIMCAASAREPLLLVGETGVGKTTILQHVAASIQQHLTVVNLSNQSEASDLLGGLKPVTTRSLMVPLIDEFNLLFDKTFAANKNAKFRQSIAKAFDKEKWSALLRHWQEAIQLALKNMPEPSEREHLREQVSKRRKLDTSKRQSLRDRWLAFSDSINGVKVHLQKGDHLQVFAFVESRLVQAIRNGGWLLLDEINLASSEALDNLLSLLHTGEDDTPYLLLAEAGSVERINAHPNFRLFAAMNPATDTGKKDLPPALRAHFTESFVHAGDDDLNDLVEIIQAYLGAYLANDKRAAADLAKAYLGIKRLASRHELTDGAGELPHFSLRSLTRCLQYVQQHQARHGLRRAMHEGLQMSFFTVLDSQSQQLVLDVVEQSLLSSSQAKRALYSHKPRNSSQADRYVRFEHYEIVKGPFSTDAQPDYIVTKSVRRNLTNLVRAASMRKFPVLLQGPTSAGKTSMVEYLAKLSGNKFVRINNHEHTDLQEYLGTYASGTDGTLDYREGVLVEALRQGHWLVLDELNLAPSDVLEALNRLLDDNRELLIPETQEIVRPHPNFMLFATQNPAGIYGGRKRLSRAFRNRFLEIHVSDIPEDELEVILKERARIAPSFCKNIVDVYKSLTLQRQSSRLFEAKNSFATLRDLFRWASRPVDDREQLAYHGYMLLAERVRDPTEKLVVKRTIEDVLKVQIDEEVMYGDIKIPNNVKSDGKITWTRAMRRLFVLVSTALQNNEPVLLVGETGCGKTQVCQCIAHAFERQLNIYNAHSNTETGDLIGSQRPMRHKSELAATIIQDLQALGEDYAIRRTDESMDIEDLITQFRSMDTSGFSEQAVKKVKDSISAYRSLFVWSDGSLVRSMRAGSHFLLDEISLADDSVLERMNSVLEPARTILLAEKGAAEDNFVAAEPGFQFLATMNPGGDYGKRELSAALRNRLTEIWVPPLSDNEDVIPILEARLKTDAPKNGSSHSDHNDRSLASSMVHFANFFRRRIEGSETSNIPLRPLLGWAEFVRQSRLDTRRALVHGAAMTFIDSLGANPAGLAGHLAEDISEARDLCLQRLHEVFDLDASEIYHAIPNYFCDADKVQISDFSLSRLPGASNEQDLVLEVPTTLRNAMRIARALQTSRPLLLEGNPGVGKTAIVTSLAQLCGRPLTRINLSDQTDLMDLFGADAPTEGEKIGNFVWRDGPLLKAMQQGDWVLLDEMNLASQSVLEGLNACLDHRKEVYIAELDKTFHCHPGFTLFATQNPHSQGSGRKGLPASFVNRFTVVYADPFTKHDLVQICRSKYANISERHVHEVVSVVDACQALASRSPNFADGGPWELNLRDLSRWLSLCEKFENLDPIIHFSTVVSDRFRQEKAKEQATTICHDTCGHFGTMFCARATLQQFVRHEHTIDIAHLQAAKSFMTAWQMDWPIILVGPSGSGKTSLIRNLAALRGDRLVEVSMNADIDTADLIGGYEQYDGERLKCMLQEQLKACLATAIHKVLAAGLDMKLEQVLSAYQELGSRQLTATAVLEIIKNVPRDLLDHDEEQMQRLMLQLQQLESTQENSTRFVWNDGVLIDALQSGAWLVLDNANLCNPSVLDRLNSLLEPNGYLVLSEQHGLDGKARIVRPAPGFKIILTADPRYGELSRAMRNRSLEIFLDTKMPEAQNSQPHLPCYPEDASIARLRPLVVDKDEQPDHGQVELEPWIDRLTADDLDLLTKPGGDVFEENVIQEAANRRSMRTLELVDPRRTPAGYTCSHLVAVNEPLMLTLVGAAMTSDQIRTRILRNTLMWNMANLNSFAKSVFAAIATGVLQEAFRNRLEYVCARDVVALCIDLIRARKPELPAYQQIASDVSTQLDSDAKLKAQLTTAVKKLMGPAPKSGQSLQTMWPIWKANTAETKDELDFQLKVEALVERFGEVAYSVAESRTQLARLRLRMLDVCTIVNSHVNNTRVLEDLIDAVEHLSMNQALTTSGRGHFAKVFDTILYKLRIQDYHCSQLQEQRCLLFSDSAIRHQDVQQKTDPMKILQRLSDASVLGPILGVDLPPAEISLQRLAQSLQNLHDQPIGRMNYAQEELAELISLVSSTPKQFSSNNLKHIGRAARELVRCVLVSHADSLNIELNNNYDFENMDTSLLELMVSAKETAKDKSKTLSDTFSDLAVVFQSFNILPDSQADAYKVCGRGLLAVAVICLKLFVPDQMFDPTTLPMLIQTRYNRRKNELTARLGAWRSFQKNTTGQDTSLVIRVLEEELSDLGEPSDVPAVYRPIDDRHLKMLHTEFQNVLRSIVNTDLVAVMHDDDTKEVKSVYNQAIPRIKNCIERLSQIHRAYDDMVKPVVGLLHCVALALHLLLYGIDVQLTAAGRRTFMHENRPHVEYRIEEQKVESTLASMRLLAEDRLLNKEKEVTVLSTPELWTYLSELRLKLVVSEIDDARRTRLHVHIVGCIDELHVLWRQKLSADQQEAERQSRYYTYRGEDDLQEPSEDDVRALFPTHEEVERQDLTQDADGSAEEIYYDSGSDHHLDIDVRKSAVELARYHRSLLAEQDVEILLQDRLRRRFCAQDETHIGFDDLSTMSPEMLPSLFLCLEDKLGGFSRQSAGQGLNIYADGDVEEVRKLFQITTQARARFQEIADRWPEHAIPAEAISYCNQVMAMKMSDSIAKLLTKTEKFLEIVAQWQAVASREWSVSSIVEALTSLIIHWRRLELGSWSRLLDVEDAKQQEDADAWYFIAYEAVVYNSLQYVQDLGLNQLESTLKDYPQKLARTLEEYLKTTTLGQFSGRLQLLSVFAQSLKACAQKLYEGHSSYLTQKTLTRLEKYSGRPLAQSDGFQNLPTDGASSSDEKDSDNESWYTNNSEIEFTMNKRERGRQVMMMHDTMVNIVQHYARYESQVSKSLQDGRVLLEKKITEQIKLASWKDTNITALRESARRTHFRLFRIIKKYRALLGQPLTNFNAKYDPNNESKPKILLELPAIVQGDAIDEYLRLCSDHIDSWLDRPERLRDPVVATKTMRFVLNSSIPDFHASAELESWIEDVSDAARELRKATPNVLTDDNGALLRDLKQRKRRLLADTLKDVAYMGVRRNLGTTELEAQSTTTMVLANLPSMSPVGATQLDSSVNEVFHELIDTLPIARESALGHSAELTDGETRRGLGYLEGFFNLAIKQRTEIGLLQSQLDRLSSIQQAFTNLDHGADTSQLESRQPWLPILLRTCARVVDFQSKHAQLQTEGVSSALRQYAERLQQIGSQNVESTSRQEVVAALRMDLTKWSDHEPQLEYLGNFLEKWFPSPDVVSPAAVKRLPIEVFDTQLQQHMNSIFVAIQRAAAVLNTLPSTNEEQGWLANSTQIFSKIITSLQLESLSDAVEPLLKSLQPNNDNTEVQQVQIALALVSTPIISQLEASARYLLAHSTHLHLQTCRAAVFLGRTFATLCKEGFCSPSEASDGQEQSGKVEQGTGLGEGDAAQDISKDVGDDEDLTELAQERGEREDGDEEMDKSKDAVDMGSNELEGEMGSDDEHVSDNNDESGGEDQEQDIDQETGNVDDLDPNAVDEKMWDEMQKQAEQEEKEMKSKEAQGQKTDDQAAGEQDPAEPGADEDIEAAGSEQEEADGEQKAEGENIDPYLDQDQALDLPEDVQLNGEDQKEDEISDADMDGLSDVNDTDNPEDKAEANLPDEEKLDREGNIEEENTVEEEGEEDQQLGQAQDNEVVEDQDGEEGRVEDKEHNSREDDAMFDAQDQEDGGAGVANTNVNLDADMDENALQGQQEAETAAQQSEPQKGAITSTQDQTGAEEGAVEQGIGRQEEVPNKSAQALQKLADVLERYHRRREIYTANEERQQQQTEQDVDMADADFEHIGDEQQEEAQALGTAKQDTVQNLDQAQAMEDSRAQADDDLPMPEDVQRPTEELQQETLAQKMTRMQQEREDRLEQQQSARTATLPDTTRDRPEKPQLPHEDAMELDNDLADDSEQPRTDSRGFQQNALRSTSLSEAQQLWSLTTNRTQSLSLLLTEQLRLILQPTTATKLRGDFRTGKRLNIRRIIPYIASGYKRDKIWMRRSIPSKRNYQVMLAVDDSRSMKESGADVLALETLCLLSRALSMLEVGELSIVAFGKDYNESLMGDDIPAQQQQQPPRAVKIAHDFSLPFSPSTSGPQTFSNFTFDQTGTNVRALLSESIRIFRDARLKSTARDATDLWQLQLIISDGHIGSDNDAVARLVRKAREEKIMCVFVIVDNSEESIVDLEEVVFEKSAKTGGGGKEGEPVMRKKRYLEGFPFQYYVVVREVRDLPGVLSRVLRGWFESVVEQG
ncbi:AAA ATPase midasin [Lithohypha guttulata]|nr:AAA ATPase midasin [Lithohypha guttulata]